MRSTEDLRNLDAFLAVVCALTAAIAAWAPDSVLQVQLPDGIQAATITLKAGSPAEVTITRS